MATTQAIPAPTVYPAIPTPAPAPVPTPAPVAPAQTASTTTATVSTTTVTTPAPTAPTPTAAHHFNVTLFLQILAALAPAISAPFVHGNTSNIINTESGVAQQLLGAYAASTAVTTP